MVSPPPLETNKDEIGIPPTHNGIQKTSRNAHGQLESSIVSCHASKYIAIQCILHSNDTLNIPLSMRQS